MACSPLVINLQINNKSKKALFNLNNKKDQALIHHSKVLSSEQSRFGA